MPSIRVPRGWEIPERSATPEKVFRSRRRFLREAGILVLGAATACGEGKGPVDSVAPATQPANVDRSIRTPCRAKIWAWR